MTVQGHYCYLLDNVKKAMGVNKTDSGDLQVLRIVHTCDYP